jgi:hypothetical protein
MPAAGPRQLLEDRFAQLSSDLETLFAESRDHTRREFAEQLNQSVRRLRLAPAPDDLCATLADSAARFASGAILFRIEDRVARNPRIDVPLSEAPALAGAVDMRDPLVALATAAEVSAALVDLLGLDAAARAHLFPVTVREQVPALVYAWGTVQGPAIELLTQVAAAVWTAIPLPKPDLVSIAPAATPAADLSAGDISSSHRPAATWEDLPAAEQRTHLRAQRFARVHVAEMRLQHSEAVQSGRIRRNLYDALRQPIDTARDTFRTQFFTCTSMVDYLDLELTRTLANENPELLGQSYPGPLL